MERTIVANFDTRRDAETASSISSRNTASSAPTSHSRARQGEHGRCPAGRGGRRKRPSRCREARRAGLSGPIEVSVECDSGGRPPSVRGPGEGRRDGASGRVGTPARPGRRTMKAAAVGSGCMWSRPSLRCATGQVVSAAQGRRSSRFSWTHPGSPRIAPKGMVLQQCWNAIGIHDQERVYIGFTARRADGREDFAVFRHDPASGSCRLLRSSWTFPRRRATSIPGEEIPKGHTHLVAHGGLDLHGLAGLPLISSEASALCRRYRGSHLYAYDPASRHARGCEPLAAGRHRHPAHRHHRARGRAGPETCWRGWSIRRATSCCSIPSAHRVQSRTSFAAFHGKRATRTAARSSPPGRAGSTPIAAPRSPRHRARRHAIWVHELGTANQPVNVRYAATGGVLERTERRRATVQTDLSRDSERRALSTGHGDAARITHLRTLPAPGRTAVPESASAPALRHRLVPGR